MRTELLDGARRAVSAAHARSEEAIAWLIAAYVVLWERGPRWWPVALLAAPLFAVAAVVLLVASAVAVVVAAVVSFGGVVALVAAPWVAIAWAVTALAGDDPKPRAPARACDPSYPEFCIPAFFDDVDCPGGGGAGPYAPGTNFRVRGKDPFSLDRDGDGIGCETRADPPVDQADPI